MKVLRSGTWKTATPKGALVGGAWKEPQKVWALHSGVWKLVWEAVPLYTPPEDKVEYVSSAVAGGTSPSPIAHQAGDLMVVVSQSISSAPPLLASGWTTAYASISSSRPLRVAWRIATASNDSWGGWSGATYCTSYVFRGFNTGTPFGDVFGTSTLASTQAITPQNTDERSQIVYYAFQSGGSGWVNLPPELKARNTPTAIFNGEKINSSLAPSLTLASTGATGYRNLTFEVLPAAGAPPYLYSVEIEYLPNYEVKITVLDGWPEGDPNEAYMFRCVQIPRDGYVGRVFNKTFVANAYGALDCTLEDISGIAGKELKTISFQITPRA